MGNGKEIAYYKDETSKWHEFWNEENYIPSVKIEKKVIDKYSAIVVQIICKGHGIASRLQLFKGDGELVTNMEQRLDGEITILTSTLPFSVESFKVFKCVMENQDHSVYAKVCNSHSYGECKQVVIYDLKFIYLLCSYKLEIRLYWNLKGIVDSKESIEDSIDLLE